MGAHVASNPTESRPLYSRDSGFYCYDVSYRQNRSTFTSLHPDIPPVGAIGSVATSDAVIQTDLNRPVLTTTTRGFEMNGCSFSWMVRHFQSSKAARRFALAMAIAGFTSSNAYAQTELPKLPEVISAESTTTIKPGESSRQVTPAVANEPESLIDIPIPGLATDQPQKLPALPAAPPSVTGGGQALHFSDSTAARPQHTSQLPELKRLPVASPENSLPPTKALETIAKASAPTAKASRAPAVVKHAKTMRLSTAPAVEPPVIESAPKTASNAFHASQVTANKGSSQAGSSRASSGSLPVPATEFRFSDSPEAPSVVKKTTPMRVRVEGEPGIATAVPGSPQGVVRGAVPEPTFSPKVVSSPSKQIPTKLASHVSAPVTRPNKLASFSREDMIIGRAMTVTHTDATPILSQRTVVEHSVEHPAICRLITTGEKTLSLIGLKPGETRIAIVTEGADGERKVELHEVHVNYENTTSANLHTVSREITQTISRLYPGSQVEIIANDGELIVQGRVQSEQAARKVLSLVRKTALTPVIDRLHSDQR